MNDARRASAGSMRARLAAGRASPAEFRDALTDVPSLERDAWLDLVCGLGELPDDGPDLPRECVPYLPCPVETLLRMVDHAEVGPDDVFVDVGAGLMRATLLTHFLTGASAIGLEVQRELVRSSRELTARLNATRVSVVEGDATQLVPLITIGSVFFLYCPFSGERLERVLCALEGIARTREIRVCCVDLPLPPCAWLTPVYAPPTSDLVVYRSTGRP